MMNASECRRETDAEALRAAAAADHPEAAPKAAPRWAEVQVGLVAVVPVLTKLILALAVVSSIVAVGTFGVTGSLSFSAAHIQADRVNVTDSQATFTWSTARTNGSAASQEQVPSRRGYMYALYPCMCCSRACSRRWTRR